jgi:predicted alpha/beta-hydrolase family hydrolase
MKDRSTLAAANQLRTRGFGVVRFNFLYKEKGSSRPDSMPKAMDTIRAVVDRVRGELDVPKLIIGGRSFGGRAASMLAAEDYDAFGLLLLAYPLHPPGQLEKLRDAHLPSITMPVLASTARKTRSAPRRSWNGAENGESSLDDALRSRGLITVSLC